MAKFQLGAIITKIAGSVGGTTFRRVPNGFSMYNKIKGTSKAKLLKNDRLPQIGNIFQRWASLSSDIRDGWNATALTVTFPDKFGVQKNITGRELFSKANIQLLPTNVSIEDSAGFTKDNIPFIFGTMTTSVSPKNVNLIFTGITETVVLMVSAEVLNKDIYQPTFKSRKVIETIVVSADGSFDIYPSVIENFPYFKEDMYVVAYVQSINDYGMVSPYQWNSEKFS